MDKYIKKKNNVFSSINDTNNYTLKKLDNGLQILFIEDKKSLISTANMYVNVGSVDNPDDTPGLAHFLEHMLFMGSSKYPDVTHFKTFITTHGGNTNAYTAHTYTYYYFSVTNNILEGLNIFSNFFVSPLFNKKYVEKEVSAVNSEHNKNINNDGWRMFSLFKKFFNDKDKKNSNFGCGTKETLLQNNDIELLENKLKKFFEEYYSAEKMVLIVSHKKINEKFINKVIEMYELIPNKKTKITDYTPHITYYDDKYEIIKMKTIKKKSIIIFNWFVKGDQHYKTDKKIIYGLLNYIIGSSSINSLDYILSNNGLIKFINISTDDVYYTHTHIRIEIELTEKGLNHYNAIIIMICTYLQNLYKSKEFIHDYFEELKKIYLMDFITQTEHDSSALAEFIITQYNLTQCPLTKILIQNIDFDDIDLDRFFNIISQMTQNKMKIILASDTFDNLTKIDEYYGTYYEQEFIELQKERDIENIYPQKNIYLTNNFLIIDKHKKSKSYIKLKSSNNNIYYVKKSNNYNTYFNVCVCYIKLDELYNHNPDYYVNLLIHLMYIEKLYENLFYDLSVSNNNIDIVITNEGLHISITSIDNDNISNLLNKILDLFFNNNKTKINEIIYNIVINNIIDNINNFYLSQSYELLNYEFKLLLNKEHNYSHDEILKHINKDLKHENSFILNGQIKGIFGGSITKKNIYKIIDILDNKFSKANITDYKNYQLYDISKTAIIKTKNKENTENAICYGINLMNYTNDILLLKCLNLLLESYIHDKFFNIIRTEKQIGYIVQAYINNVKNSKYPEYYLCFIIQSSLKNLKEIVIDFIKNNYINLIDELSETEYEFIKNSIAKYLKDKKININDEINEKINLLELKDKYQKKEKFDTYLQMSKIIKNITQKDFTDYAKTIINNKVSIVEIQS